MRTFLRHSGLFVAFAFALLLSSPATQAQELLLFGGNDHRQFLGCLNCSKFEANSIWNQFGTYGSQFNAVSIWNRFGTYGSKFSAYSPWNQFSSQAPAVVDRQGNFYGYFSANKFHPKRTTIPSLVFLLDKYDSIVERLDEIRATLR